LSFLAVASVSPRLKDAFLPCAIAISYILHLRREKNKKSKNTRINFENSSQVCQRYRTFPSALHGLGLDLHGIHDDQGHRLREREASEGIHARHGPFQRHPLGRLVPHLVHRHGPDSDPTSSNTQVRQDHAVQ